MTDLNSDPTILPAKPFKLGTTSFIVPDNIIPNVKKLGLFFDEIELLVFESQPKEVLPSKDDIKQLLYLSQKYDLSFNVHLPTDMSITHQLSKTRLKAVDTTIEVMELFAPLTPTTYTLHIDMQKDVNIQNGLADPSLIKQWQNRVRKSFEALLPYVPKVEIISIETLEYPFNFVEPIIEEFNLSVCIDAGHQ
ncbi:hypothetical protein KAJ27_10295, partial [bacterium]|nr:hypothetical protein [bacterium]